MIASAASSAFQEAPVPERDLCFTPATELVRLFRARKVSPAEVMDAVFARIDRLNPRLNAYVTLDRD
jgi:Asp-tRNA(Asn)/Glu-tRNA(Gln) amidotransferase A subunit family amidase